MPFMANGTTSYDQDRRRCKGYILTAPKSIHKKKRVCVQPDLARHVSIGVVMSTELILVGAVQGSFLLLKSTNEPIGCVVSVLVRTDLRDVSGPVVVILPGVETSTQRRRLDLGNLVLVVVQECLRIAVGEVHLRQRVRLIVACPNDEVPSRGVGNPMQESVIHGEVVCPCSLSA